ncbi:MAG: thioredoxin family protein [Sulfurimonas sp.]|uniref:thioredoxin family protein n=1 Tax=Sulfurimonas sp. TaxID=2022749 RepID=UPI0025F0090E|nr:thioredoxin family protein [Sulfurimonas sp.]MCK9455447.1 thioredoxin family protein [Sulfurimonas sp.]
MRHLILIMALLFNLSALDWPNDYEEALVDAKKENKDIYLFIGSEYCKYCEKFEKEVLSQDEVIQRLKKSYVLIYLSRDIDDIPEEFETTPVPRHYFLTKDGKVILTTIGGRSVEGFYDLLDEVKETKEL